MKELNSFFNQDERKQLISSRDILTTKINALDKEMVDTRRTLNAIVDKTRKQLTINTMLLCFLAMVTSALTLSATLQLQWATMLTVVVFLILAVVISYWLLITIDFSCNHTPMHLQSIFEKYTIKNTLQQRAKLDSLQSQKIITQRSIDEYNKNIEKLDNE